MARNGDKRAQERMRSGALQDARHRRELQAKEASSTAEAYANAYESNNFDGTWKDLPPGAQEELARRGW